MSDLPKMLLHPGNGDASILINGYKMPPGAVIGRDYSIEPMGGGLGSPVAVTLTFFASEVTVLDLSAAENPSRHGNDVAILADLCARGGVVGQDADTAIATFIKRRKGLTDSQFAGMDRARLINHFGPDAARVAILLRQSDAAEKAGER